MSFVYLMKQVTVDAPCGLHFTSFCLCTFCIWIYDRHLTSDILTILSSYDYIQISWSISWVTASFEKNVTGQGP